MPEGHTIHRLARDHHRWFSGQVVTLTSPQGRFETGARALSGWLFLRAFAHGKHLFYVFEQENSKRFIHIHLGLFGRFRMFKDVDKKPTPNVRLRIAADNRVVDLSGPTRCEVLTISGVERVRRRLGPDPLAGDSSAEDCFRSFARRRASIAAVLMDQAAIAGIGNIYRSELLFRHRIDPTTPACELSEETVAALWGTAVEWLTIGVKTNSIITTLPPGTSRVPRPRPRERVAIYKARYCPSCGGDVQRSEVRQRTVYACPQCQQRRS